MAKTFFRFFEFFKFFLRRFKKNNAQWVWAWDKVPPAGGLGIGHRIHLWRLHLSGAWVPRCGQCLDGDRDAVLSEADILQAVAEVAPRKDLAPRRRQGLWGGSAPALPRSGDGGRHGGTESGKPDA